MATLTKFEEIEAWQKARELTRAVYQPSRKGDFSRDYALRDQVRRAATSVMANIAEGFERGGTTEFIQAGFMSYLRRSRIKGLKYKEPSPPGKPQTTNQKPETRLIA